MLKKYISREPEGNVVPIDDTDGATVAVAGVIHQDGDPELGEVPDLEGYLQREGARDVKLGDELPEDLRSLLREVIRRYPEVLRGCAWPWHIKDWYIYICIILMV